MAHEPRRTADGTVPRRAPGELESELLAAVWSSEVPLTAREVGERHGAGLAATTVLTILGRLERKGAVARRTAGRGSTFEALVAPAELTARRMRQLLADDEDHSAVLQQFVDGLAPVDEDRLHELLRQARDRRR